MSSAGMTAAQAIEQASANCKRLAVDLKESGDGVQRARGAFIENVLPPFYAWLYAMEAHGATPADATLAFGQEVATMLANMAHNCAQDHPDRWVDFMGQLLVIIAKQQMAGGPAVRITGKRS